MNATRPFSQAVWDQTPAVVQDDREALEVRVTAWESAVQRLEATVQHVTEQVQQTSRHSSRPPSSDPPQASGKPSRRAPSGRRPGGQAGHAGPTRALVPVEAVDVVVPVQPERCHSCRHPWQGEEPHPQRQQVTESPPVKPVVPAYQRHRLICPACGEASRAALPPGGPTGGFGPRVQATTALCPGAYHLSKRMAQALLDDLVGVAGGLSTIANLEQATTQAVAEPVAAAEPDAAKGARPVLETRGGSAPLAEVTRALRPGVIARNVSPCSKNDRGAHAFAAFTSVVRTLTKQGIDSLVDGLYHLFRSPNLHTAPP